VARPRAFDNDVALDAAVACFWRRGLEATSVRELAHEMGLSGPSVYNAFGDKRRLFLQALERYAETRLRERLARLETLPSARAALKGFFDEIIERSVGDPERRGCLIINTAMDAAPHDAEITQAVSRYFSEIERFLHGRVMAAAKAGEISAAVDPRDTGRMLLGLLVGMRVLSRTGASKAELQAMLRPAMATLARPAPRAGAS
jgi:TetR/AcrR family transcriptional regulator, transcriptional repressor for nem operon